MQLAELYAAHGREQEALALIKDHMHGVHQDSPYVLFTYALIQFQNHDHAGARATIAKLEAVSDSVRRRERALLKARIAAALGEEPAATDQLRDACRGYLGEEARYRYAAHLQHTARPREALTVADEGIAFFKGSERLYRRQERPWFRGLKAVRAAAKKELKAI